MTGAAKFLHARDYLLAKIRRVELRALEQRRSLAERGTQEFFEEDFEAPP
jgi:hypothetical protein